MPIYSGLFLIAFATLSLEISLSRMFSVITWYHMAFFAVSTAMLGMTAGATSVYMRPEKFRPERLPATLAGACVAYAGSTIALLIVLCLMPYDIGSEAVRLLQLIVMTGACSLPFYFGGLAISAVLTKSPLPVTRLYSSDLLGAALGCLFVLGGMALLDAPSLILLSGALGGAAALCFGRGDTAPEGARQRRLAYAALAGLPLLVLLNAVTPIGLRPVVVKGKIEDQAAIQSEDWNSFSRIAVYKEQPAPPQLWGASPKLPEGEVAQRYMNIDGEAGTSVSRFATPADIEYLRYDVTNVAYYLRPSGGAAVIGVGGGRDIQSALLFGHEQVTGVELNPIFIDLLETEFRDFAGVAGRPGVKLVVDEARSYMSRTDERFPIIQMSLIDTWAATGAGAFSLSENGLYTIEAWTVFFNRLQDDGLFTVSRWYNPETVDETGRALSLAAATLHEAGISDPSRHIALIASGNVSTLVMSRQPFAQADLDRLRQVAADLEYKILLLPGQPSPSPLLNAIISAPNREALVAAVRDEPVNYEPTTDENPYFFNMLRLGNLGMARAADTIVLEGNLTATFSLLKLLICLLAGIILTIILPLRIRGRSAEPAQVVWPAAIYFSLIGAGFMCVEIALMQRLSVFLGHPTYALGILLFTIIASTGVGSFISERLPITRAPWAYVAPAATALAILAMRFAVSATVAELITAPMATKIAVSVLLIFPMGLLLGLFFPTGMRIMQAAGVSETPWYWALNGIFGVFCSAFAVLVSIYAGISVNFYIGVACYGLLTLCLRGMLAAGQGREAGQRQQETAPALAGEEA